MILKKIWFLPVLILLAMSANAANENSLSRSSDFNCESCERNTAVFLNLGSGAAFMNGNDDITEVGKTGYQFQVAPGLS